MKRALRHAFNLVALSVMTMTARVAKRKSRRSARADSHRDPSNLALLGLGLLALALGYRK
ncbi:MAG: hypothetical protein ACXW2G_03670 [Burkholderiaceae bacterium]